MSELGNLNKIDHQVLSLISEAYVRSNKSNPLAIYLDDFTVEKISYKEIHSSLYRLMLLGKIINFQFVGGYIYLEKNGKQYVPIYEQGWENIFQTDNPDVFPIFSIGINEGALLDIHKVEMKSILYVLDKDGRINLREGKKNLFNKESARFKILCALIAAKGKFVSTKELVEAGGKKNVNDLFKEIPAIEKGMAKVLGLSYQRGIVISEGVRGSGYKLLLSIRFEKEK